MRCSAAYDSDFFWFTVDSTGNGCGDPLSCHSPPSPLTCPSVSDAIIMQSWFVYNDLVFYSSDSVYWNDLYTIWGKSAFPSVYEQPVSPRPPTDHTVLVKFGDDKDIRLSSEQFKKMMSLLNSLQSVGKSGLLSDEKMEEREELMSLLGLRTKVPEVKEERVDGYFFSEIDLPSLTLRIRRKDDVEYFIKTNE